MNQPPKYLKQSIRALFKELNLPITQIMWSYDKYICYFRRKRVQSGYRMSAKRTFLLITTELPSQRLSLTEDGSTQVGLNRLKPFPSHAELELKSCYDS